MLNISVVVLTCNQAAYTLRLLETLTPWLKNNPDSELIIVDNGSTDNTSKIIEESGLISPSQLHYIYNAKNLGVAGGRNIGLRKASKDLILILDNDTEVSSEAIDGLRSHIATRQNCGLCAPALISPSGDIQDSAKPFPGLGIKIAHVLDRKGRSRSEEEAMKSPHPFYVIGACQMFRRSIIDEIGLLDENIFYGPEDADWCMRIRNAGYTIDYLPQYNIIHHWQRATNRSPFSPLSRLHLRALLYFYRKHHRLF